MRQSTLKLELLFLDRKKIVENITAVISRHDLNIIAMEVDNKDEKTLIYLETRSSKFSPSNPVIVEALEKIPDLIEIRQINAMPQEVRETRLKVVLDSISDGILSIDNHGYITTVNRVARKVLGWNSPDIVGKKLSDMPPETHALLDTLKGESFINKKRNIITENGRFQFFSTGLTIKDYTGETTGAIEIMRNMREIKALADEVTYPSLQTFSDIIGKSSVIMDAISFAQKIAPSAAIVSIRGQSGTGKELFARAIHAESMVPGRFVAVNCAALPESLLESELFGYTKGAFTGAEKKGKPGLFELADHGTLFLDEIAELSPGSQAKILRVIQEKTVRRIGGEQEFPVHARIITATSKVIEELIKTGGFREDLYYRINVLPIHVPPLKERLEDIPLLAEHFLSRTAKQTGRKTKRLTLQALARLNQHLWPGNVRELKNVIERASIISDKDCIDSDSIVFGHEIEQTIKGLARTGSIGDRRQTLKDAVGKFEKNLIETELEKQASVRQCARAFGLSHTALLKKLKKYGIRAGR